MVISLHQPHRKNSNIDIYFGCALKGHLKMPFTLKAVHEKFPNTKVKIFHGEDLDIQVGLSK